MECLRSLLPAGENLTHYAVPFLLVRLCRCCQFVLHWQEVVVQADFLKMLIHFVALHFLHCCYVDSFPYKTIFSKYLLSFSVQKDAR